MIYRQPGTPIRVEIREEIRPRFDSETQYISVTGLLTIVAFYAAIIVLFRAIA